MWMNDNWTVTQWLDFIEHRHKELIHLRLENARQVAQNLSVLNPSIPVITVAGTNGKGSTVVALSAIYQAAGYQVGAFTSPHLLQFNERICINQQPISDSDLCYLFQKVEAGRGNIALTYFEVSLLVALVYFQEQKVDVLILEVGMGGRLDATNIIDADLAIITTIDLDHQDFLGHDKETIGKEKAGILRDNQLFIYADLNPPQSILDSAKKLHTKTYRLGQDYHYENRESFLFDSSLLPKPLNLSLPNLHPNAAAAAIMASICLQARLPVKEQHWDHAMQRVRIAARQQWFLDSISFVYDVAHNPQAALALAQSIQNKSFKGHIHAVFSALQDKDICGLIRPLSPFVKQWYPAVLQSPRASSSEQLVAAFNSELTISPHCYADPIQATQAAVAAAQEGDLIVVYGSFVLVGAVMQMYVKG